MDISVSTAEGRFNYRVCAVIIKEGRLLAVRDRRSPYSYLPGGRVTLHERAEDAVLREVREELGVPARVVRPLWLCQSYFTEDVSGERYHEMCLYFLVEVSDAHLPVGAESFPGVEPGHSHQFSWLPVDALEGEYLYPLFIKTAAARLPQSLTLITEIQ